MVKKSSRCAYCFGRHYLAKCRAAVTCPRPGCQYRHNTLLHHDEPPGQKRLPPAPPATGPSREPDAFMGVAQQGTNTIYGVARVRLNVNGKAIVTCALTDSGSSTTFLRTSLARRLGLVGPRTTMMVAWTDMQLQEITTERHEIHIEGTETGTRYTIQLQTMDCLALPRHTLTTDTVKEQGLDDWCSPITWYRN